MLRFDVGQAYAVELAEGWALIDTGPTGHAQEILGSLRRLGAHPDELRAILLTHSHPDHTGSAAALASITRAPILAGAADAAIIRGEAPQPPPVLLDWERPLFETYAAPVPPAPPAPVHRELGDGDDLHTPHDTADGEPQANWGEPAAIVAVPGHTPGSIALHLPSSGVLFTGDTVANGADGVMLGVFNIDRALAISSFHRQAALNVEVACFGHGDPLTSGAAATLRAVAERLE